MWNVWAAIPPVFHRVVMMQSEDAVAEGMMRVSMPYFQRPAREARVVPPKVSVSNAPAPVGSSNAAHDSGRGGEWSPGVLARDRVLADGGLGMATFFQQVLKHRAYNRNQILDDFINLVSEHNAKSMDADEARA